MSVDLGTEQTPDITLVGASAGTGKTYRLASVFADAVLGCSGPPIHPSKILAVTFTNKAADELLERVRQLLMERGAHDSALQVGSAYIGTVNAVCGRLLEEHAFQSGISPSLSVLPPEELASAMAIAAESVIEDAADTLDEIAGRLSQDEWKDLIHRIVNLARSNAVSPASFDSFAKNSWLSLQLLLPASTTISEDQLDAKLREAIDTAIIELQNVGDTTKLTRDALILLQDKRSTLRANRSLGWNEWAQLSKLKTGKASLKLVEPVVAAATNHAAHPRLHRDIEQFITAIFECSAQALNEYESFKRAYGFVDFTDQEYLTLNLLKEPAIQKSISERIELALIDEFQDTSPIQLAIFSKLSQSVRQSVWVGDEKQAIYGFRGTDPELMQSVVAEIDRCGGKREQLEKSYRSRPSLVEFTNNVFGMSFESVGIDISRVHINECNRAEHRDHGVGLVVCQLQGKRSSEASNSTADFIVNVISDSSKWMVEDRASKELRAIVGGDIAVLCRSNDRCEALATALMDRGVKASYQRYELLQTSECILAFAALRYLVDKRDSLAMAEILHITQEESHRYEWLNDWLSKEREKLHQSSAELVALDEARGNLIHLTPMEALETAIRGAGVVERSKRWGNARSRLSNIDALRGLAVRFEDLCMAQRRAATPAGLVTFLYREVEQGGEQPASFDSNAVQILTYHGSKGLEYPMAILADLDGAQESSPFGAFAESAGNNVPLNDPLKDRWIRLWPWPYGAQRKNVHLDISANASTEMISFRKRDTEEKVRLLYVGATRARDYLVLGCTSDVGWLDSLKDSSGTQVMQLPTEAGEHNLRIGSREHKLLLIQTPKPADNVTPRPMNDDQVFTSRPAQARTSYAPLRSQPSSLKSVLPEFESDRKKPGQIHQIGSRLELHGEADMTVIGDVFHAFFAADNLDGQAREECIGFARQLLRRWKVNQLDPRDLVDASDRLSLFLKKRFPESRISKECAIFGNMDGQRVHGRIDMIVETKEGIVIIDHKTFPGAYDKWIERAVGYRSQLSIYGELASRGTGMPVRELLVHLPIVGVIMDVT